MVFKSKDISCKRKQKQSERSYSYIRQLNFKLKMVTRDKKDHYIMMKGSIYKENIIIITRYTQNTRESEYMKQILIGLKGETSNNVIITRN